MTSLFQIRDEIEHGLPALQGIQQASWQFYLHEAQEIVGQLPNLNHGPHFIGTVFPVIWIPIVKIRWSYHCFIFIIGICILLR